MAGAGARTRKDGTPSAKVGSPEVLSPRLIGPRIPMKRQIQAMATGASSAARQAKTPAAVALAAELRGKAETARAARTAWLATRRGDRAAAQAAAAAKHEAGARAMRAGAAAQFAKGAGAAKPAVTAKGPEWSKKALTPAHEAAVAKAELGYGAWGWLCCC